VGDDSAFVQSDGTAIIHVSITLPVDSDTRLLHVYSIRFNET